MLEKILADSEFWLKNIFLFKIQFCITLINFLFSLVLQVAKEQNYPKKSKYFAVFFNVGTLFSYSIHFSFNSNCMIQYKWFFTESTSHFHLARLPSWSWAILLLAGQSYFLLFRLAILLKSGQSCPLVNLPWRKTKASTFKAFFFLTKLPQKRESKASTRAKLWLCNGSFDWLRCSPYRKLRFVILCWKYFCRVEFFLLPSQTNSKDWERNLESRSKQIQWFKRSTLSMTRTLGD